jgi:Response regulator containing a CheY-like receiver domain and an HTH DNA-binding domain
VEGTVIRVIVVDDEALVRVGLRTILESVDDIEVVGEAASAQAAVVQARALAPDVVCMDIRMPGGSGLEATVALRSLDPAPEVVVITTFDLDEYVFGALEAGACGVLLKDSPVEVLVEGVRRASRKEGLVDASLTRRVIAEFARRRGPSELRGTSAAGITPRELDCLRQLCEGLTNAEIARKLWLEPSTVKTHLSSLMAKTRTFSRVQLVIWAFRSGVVAVE